MLFWIIFLIILAAVGYGAYWLYKEYKGLGSALNPG